MKKPLLKEILLALSLSNLLFIKTWRALIYPTSEVYHIKLEPSSMDYLGIVLSVLLVTGVFLGGLWLSRRLNKGKTPIITKLIFLGIFAVVLNGIRVQFFKIEPGLNLIFGILILILLLGIFVLIKWQSRFWSFTKAFVIMLSPFVIITFSQSILGFLKENPPPEATLATQLSAIQPKEKPGIKNRVVWIIFDEFDYFVPFGTTPPIVNLPQLLRLKNESLSATNATSPDYSTIQSIPSLFTGKIVKKSETVNKTELKLEFEKNETAKFSETSNIFRKIKEIGGETALVGWYHPYCRVIGNDLSACQWESVNTVNDYNQSLSNKITKNIINCFYSLPFVLEGFYTFELRLQDRSGYIQRHYDLLNGTKLVVSNPNIDLAFLHLPFPHAPNFFDKSTGDFRKPDNFSSLSNYSDNLVLTDQVLGEIRQTMEAAHLWDDSIVIVSSDHQWRVNLWRNSLAFSKDDFELTQGVEHPNIPFILKLKGQKEGLSYDKSFNTVITHDLILALMKGEISTANEVKTWLDNVSK